MAFRFLRTAILDFINLLYPTLCLGCSEPLGDNETILCTHCRISLPETNLHRPEQGQHHLYTKFAGKVPIDFLSAYVYFGKGGIVQKLIHAIKYKGQKEAAKVIAEWYGHQLKSESNCFQEIDMLIGVPLHTSRLQQRGYNQADWIAEGLAESLGIPLQTDIIIRNQFRGSQTRKNRLERWENVKTVFEVPKPEAVKDKQIILVDDVLTTGATLETCAVALLNAGCKSVSILTLAATK